MLCGSLTRTPSCATALCPSHSPTLRAKREPTLVIWEPFYRADLEARRECLVLLCMWPGRCHVEVTMSPTQCYTLLRTPDHTRFLRITSKYRAEQTPSPRHSGHPGLGPALEDPPVVEGPGSHRRPHASQHTVAAA